MNNRITQTQIPSNEEMAVAYFPHLVRDLPQYRQDLLRETPRPLTWHEMGKYVSTYYVALCCASSLKNLAVLGQELGQFVQGIPFPGNDKGVLLAELASWIERRQRGMPALENIFRTLVEVGETLTSTIPQRAEFFRFIYVLYSAHTLVVDQSTLDRFRQALEPISERIGQRSSAEEW